MFIFLNIIERFIPLFPLSQQQSTQQVERCTCLAGPPRSTTRGGVSISTFGGGESGWGGGRWTILVVMKLHVNCLATISGHLRETYGLGSLSEGYQLSQLSIGSEMTWIWQSHIHFLMSDDESLWRCVVSMDPVFCKVHEDGLVLGFSDIIFILSKMGGPMQEDPLSFASIV